MRRKDGWGLDEMWVILCVCVWRVSKAAPTKYLSICLVCLCVCMCVWFDFFGVCVCFAARIGVSGGGGSPFYNHQTNITTQEAF